MRARPALAAALALLPTMALGQAPATAVDQAVQKAFPTSRLYAVSATGGMAAQDGTKMCMDGAQLRKMVAALETADPKDLARIGKGCKTTVEQTAPNAKSVSVVCEKAAGAPADSRVTIAGSVEQIHQHFEFTLQDFAKAGQAQVISSDVTLTHVGACPANMKAATSSAATARCTTPWPSFAPWPTK